MNTYYLIRHGQDEDNSNGILNGHRDTSLTQIGLDQASQVSLKVKKLRLNIDYVFSSPLQRALRTAEILTQITYYPDPILEPLLIERDFGVVTGELQSRIIELCSPEVIVAGKINYFLSPKNAETFPDLINRANVLLEKYESKYQNKTIIFVTHGDFGKMIYCSYYKLQWQNVLTAFHFGNSEVIKLSPDTDPEKSKIISIDQYNT